jgi:hypothetical protein
MKTKNIGKLQNIIIAGTLLSLCTLVTSSTIADSKNLRLKGTAFFSLDPEYYYLKEKNNFFKIKRNKISPIAQTQFDEGLYNGKSLEVELPEESIETSWNHLDENLKQDLEISDDGYSPKLILIGSGKEKIFVQGKLDYSFDTQKANIITQNEVYTFLRKDILSEKFDFDKNNNHLLNFLISKDSIEHLGLTKDFNQKESGYATNIDKNEQLIVVSGVAVIAGKKIYSFDKNVDLIQTNNVFTQISKTTTAQFENFQNKHYGTHVNLSVPVAAIVNSWSTDQYPENDVTLRAPASLK